MTVRDRLDGSGEYIAPDHTRRLAQMLDSSEALQRIIEDESFQRTVVVKRALARPLDD